jgi:NADH-ubiquinone oxidoreductase chain 4
VFFVPHALGFYFMFEISLLPIILIIFGWGYQPERVPAAYALVFYTVTASFPLLVFLLYLNFLGCSHMGLWATLSKGPRHAGSWLTFFLLAGFLVKLPIFAFHLWLPKAHVEAPVVGSIILAALLLKLGGYGLWRFLALLPLRKFRIFRQSLSLIGGGLIAILCTRQTDIKILIAYSSVAHMSLVIAALIAQTSLGSLAAFRLIIAHGVSSSAIFAGANFIYESTHTRRLRLTTGLLNYLPALSLFWFLARLGNMGAPPTINLMAEIWSINTVAVSSYLTWGPIAALSFFATAYTLILYSSSQQGQPSSAFQASPNISSASLLVITLHIIWLVEGFILFIYSNFNFYKIKDFRVKSSLGIFRVVNCCSSNSRFRKSISFWVWVYPASVSPCAFFIAFFFNNHFISSIWCWISAPVPLPTLALVFYQPHFATFTCPRLTNSGSGYWVISKYTRVI